MELAVISRFIDDSIDQKCRFNYLIDAVASVRHLIDWETDFYRERDSLIWYFHSQTVEVQAANLSAFVQLLS